MRYLCGEITAIQKQDKTMCADLQTPNKYVDMLTDFGFKRIFGDKELLIAFLNDGYITSKI